MATRKASARPESRPTYPLGVVSRLTGLSPDVLRAWERRYQVVKPLRTPGGTRRYRESDVKRLRLLSAASAAGYPIGDLAKLDDAELEQRAGSVPRESARGPIAEILRALDEIDAARAEEMMARQLSALGPVRFARDFALPLLASIGDAWSGERLCVAGEHLGSALLRSLLGAGLRPTSASLLGPPIVFGTLAGERHELGLLIAALTALGAGANPVYLGADLPVQELLGAVEKVDARAVALSLVILAPADARRGLKSLRAGLEDDVRVWVGGARAAEIELPTGVELLRSLDDLESKVALLERTSRNR